MPRKREKTAVPRSSTHEAFARNLARVIKSSPQGSVNGWAKAKRLQQTTVNRILLGDQSPSLDTVDEISRACGFQPWQLLIADIDLTDPPDMTLTRRERDLYKRVVEDLKSLPNV